MKLLILGVLSFFLFISQAQAYQVPANLHKAIIAEDTSGDPVIYKNIVSCVRNRLEQGMSHGLVAMKRKNLNSFVQKEREYALKTKGIDLESQAKKAIYEVFILKKDYCAKATHYEHTGIYKKPKWAKHMRVVKILFEGTKSEITFWREK